MSAVRAGLAAALLAAAATRSAAATGEIAALLPADGFAPGWARAGPAASIVGAHLYDLIDGAAEVFLEMGFERAVVQDYVRGGESLTVDLYLMTDEVAAAGVYLLKAGRGERHPRIAGRHAYTPRQVVLYRGRVLGIVTDDGGGAAGAVVAAAAALVARLPAESPLPLAEMLPSEGRREGSLRLARGPFSLQRIYTFGEGDPLALGGRIPAVAAAYDGGRDGSFTRIAVAYPDQGSAAAATLQLRASLDASVVVLRERPDGLVFRDGAGRFGTVRRAGARLDITVDRTRLPAD